MTKGLNPKFQLNLIKEGIYSTTNIENLRDKYLMRFFKVSKERLKETQINTLPKSQEDKDDKHQLLASGIIKSQFIKRIFSAYEEFYNYTNMEFIDFINEIYEILDSKINYTKEFYFESNGLQFFHSLYTKDKKAVFYLDQYGCLKTELTLDELKSLFKLSSNAQEESKSDLDENNINKILTKILQTFKITPEHQLKLKTEELQIPSTRPYVSFSGKLEENPTDSEIEFPRIKIYTNTALQFLNNSFNPQTAINEEELWEKLQNSEAVFLQDTHDRHDISEYVIKIIPKLKSLGFNTFSQELIKMNDQFLCDEINNSEESNLENIKECIKLDEIKTIFENDNLILDLHLAVKKNGMQLYTHDIYTDNDKLMRNIFGESIEEFDGQERLQQSNPYWIVRIKELLEQGKKVIIYGGAAHSNDVAMVLDIPVIGFMPDTHCIYPESLNNLIFKQPSYPQHYIIRLSSSINQVFFETSVILPKEHKELMEATIDSYINLEEIANKVTDPEIKKVANSFHINLSKGRNELFTDHKGIKYLDRNNPYYCLTFENIYSNSIIAMHHIISNILSDSNQIRSMKFESLLHACSRSELPYRNNFEISDLNKEKTRFKITFRDKESFDQFLFYLQNKHKNRKQHRLILFKKLGISGIEKNDRNIVFANRVQEMIFSTLTTIALRAKIEGIFKNNIFVISQSSSHDCCHFVYLKCSESRSILSSYKYVDVISALPDLDNTIIHKNEFKLGFNNLLLAEKVQKQSDKFHCFQFKKNHNTFFSSADSYICIAVSESLFNELHNYINNLSLTLKENKSSSSILSCFSVSNNYKRL